jgi:hypothetical protein
MAIKKNMNAAKKMKGPPKRNTKLKLEALNTPKNYYAGDDDRFKTLPSNLILDNMGASLRRNLTTLNPERTIASASPKKKTKKVSPSPKVAQSMVGIKLKSILNKKQSVPNLQLANTLFDSSRSISAMSASSINNRCTTMSETINL